MSSNFNNAKIINVYYNKGDRKPYDVNGKPIAYIGEEFVGSNESSEIRFFFGQDLDSATPIIITKRPDGQTYLDLCEKIGTGVNSYYRVFLNDWYAEVKGKLTIVFKVYNGSVTFNEGNTEILTASGQVIVSDIFNLEVGYAPLATSAVPPFDPSPETSWYFALSQKLDKAQSITVTGALPTLTGDVYDDRYFYVENEGVGRLYYINGSTAIEVVWQVGTLRLTPTGNGDVTADTGKLSWNQPNGTVNVGLYNNVNVGVGEDVIYYVKATGAITKGDVIQYAGFQGDHALAKRAVQSEVNANPKLIMGIAKQNITNGDFGYVAHFGKLEGVDTKSQAVNSFVWFDSAGSTAGNWTTTQPTAPNAKILLAVIIKAESAGPANNGVLLVRPTIEPKLEELQNVLITSVANGNVLSYDGTKWVNSTRLSTAESNITNLQGRMTTEEANVDNLQGRMTSAEGDIDDIESGATIVPRALGDQNGNTINTTYLTQSSASATYIPLSQKAQANGVATLGADGRVVASQIPGVVTSLEEYDDVDDFPVTGFLTVVYLAIDTGLTYLWSGTQYVIISSSLALGESSTTAYRGDRGKIAYDYSQVGHLPLAGGTVTGNLVVGGDLTISGTTTTINTETIGIKDNLILINSNQTGTPSTALKGGLEIERGDLTNFQFVFDENDDRFKVGQIGSLQTVATRTDDGTIANRGITYFNTSTNRLENNANIVIDSDNKVGIGTASPTTTLQVNGSFLLKPSTADTGFIVDGENGVTNQKFDVQLSKDGGAYSVYKIRYGNDNLFSWGGSLSEFANNMTINNPVGLMKFDTNGSERMRISSAGNIGIGTTNPVTKLQIHGEAWVGNQGAGTAGSQTGALYLGGVLEGSQIWYSASIRTINNASSPLAWQPRLGFFTQNTGEHLNTNQTERLSILAGSGNVGIGTTNPSILGFGREFSVSANGLGLPTSYINVQGSRTDDNDVGGLVFHNIVSGTNVVVSSIGSQRSGANNSGNLIFYTSNAGTNSERMRITSGGDVGIGTPPSSKLDILETSAKRIRSLNGNSSSQGAAQNHIIVRHVPVTSNSSRLLIRIIPQGGLNSTTVMKILGHSSKFNNATPLSFQATIQVGHLFSVSNVSSYNVGGNISSIAAFGDNDVAINFTSDYSASTADGIFITIEYMTNNTANSIDVNNIRMA